MSWVDIDLFSCLVINQGKILKIDKLIIGCHFTHVTVVITFHFDVKSLLLFSTSTNNRVHDITLNGVNDFLAVFKMSGRHHVFKFSDNIELVLKSSNLFEYFESPPSLLVLFNNILTSASNKFSLIFRHLWPLLIHNRLQKPKHLIIAKCLLCHTSNEDLYLNRVNFSNIQALSFSSHFGFLN